MTQNGVRIILKNPLTYLPDLAVTKVKNMIVDFELGTEMCERYVRGREECIRRKEGGGGGGGVLEQDEDVLKLISSNAII